jgi:hypothetical protein
VGYILRGFCVSPLFIGGNTVMDIEYSLDFPYTELISPKPADYRYLIYIEIYGIWD